MNTLSRAFECASGGHPIHEAPGEQNHIYLWHNDNGFETEIGPFCPDCVCKRLNITMEELRKEMA